MGAIPAEGVIKWGTAGGWGGGAGGGITPQDLLVKNFYIEKVLTITYEYDTITGY